MRVMAAVFGLLLLAAGGGEPAPKPVLVVHGDTTFVDDAYALSPSGGRLAYVRSNGADIAQVEVAELPSGNVEARFSIAAFSRIPERLSFTENGKLIVVGRLPDAERREAQVFDLSGKPLGRKLGPADSIACAQIDGKSALVALSIRRSGEHTSYEVSALRAEDGKALGRRTLSAGRDGLIKLGEGFRIVYWSDDLLHLTGVKKGEYDKKNDVRRPDRAMIFDVLAGKAVSEHEIGDVVSWVREMRQREQFPQRAAFVAFSEDLKALELITADNRRLEVKTVRPLWKYEPKTILQQAGPEPGRLYVSLTVDPVNPEAVKKQKTDPDLFDLYAVDGQSGSAARVLGGVLAAKRRLAWVAGGGRVAILRRHQGFDRGGTELEVYDLSR
ncbi:MAG TPA: hypothetical protein VKN99_17555 [Polyangia bacterium]|nr:hypothetical protein [Polyangia bacterium]